MFSIGQERRCTRGVSIPLFCTSAASDGAGSVHEAVNRMLPALLRSLSTDEYAPLPPSDTDRRAIAQYESHAASTAARAGLALSEYIRDRRGTAASLLAVNDAHDTTYYDVRPEAAFDLEAANDAFRADGPVVDVQTHFVDPGRWNSAAGAALTGFLQMADPERWGDGIDPRLIDAAAWATLVFGTSETAIALLTSTPGTAAHNVLTNDQIAAARDVVERYAGTGRLLTHAIVHPNVGRRERDAMPEVVDMLRPSGWKTYTLWGPPTAASPTGGWFLDDEELGFPFLERVRDLGPRVVAAHKGLSGPFPGAALPAASPRDVGPAAAAFPEVTFVVYHSGYERDPDGEEGPYRGGAGAAGVDRLVESLAGAGIGHDGNVYAELGSTWFLMLRRPLEAAHVLGKLLVALGPDRILWGTDSIWYGSPQPLIDAFRAFQIPEPLRERYGYPALTPDVKDRILHRNACVVYGVDDEIVRRAAGANPGWITNGAAELQRVLDDGGS
jgi:uncharacterized protein